MLSSGDVWIQQAIGSRREDSQAVQSALKRRVLGKERGAWGHYAPSTERDYSTIYGISAYGDLHESSEPAAALPADRHAEYDYPATLEKKCWKHGDAASKGASTRGIRPSRKSGSLFSPNTHPILECTLADDA